jgi:Ca2+-binding RTX toxin-like protein
MALTITASTPLGETVTDDHFGVNFIDEWEGLENLEQFLGSSGNSENSMGITSLRWPGGSDIEDYELNLSSGVVSLDRMSPPNGKEGTLSISSSTGDPDGDDSLDSFLEFCGDNNVEAKIIIPTEWLVDEQNASIDDITITDAQKDAVKAFVMEAMALAVEHGATISGFEIGNEYQSYFTPAGYAEVLNALVPTIDAAIGENGPDIIAQMNINTSDGGDPLEDDGGNPTLDNPSDSYDLSVYNESGVLGNLDAGIADMIDGLASHFYFQEGQETAQDTTGEWIHTYDNIDDIIAQVADMASAWGNDIDLHITEWGVQSVALAGEDTNWGMQQLAPTLEIFSSMIKYGVDSADIWPMLYHTTALANDGGKLRPIGQLIDLMNDALPGKHVVDVDTSAHGNYDIHLFIGDGEGVAFFSSLTDTGGTKTIDLTDIYGTGYGNVTVQVITFDAASGDTWETTNSVGVIDPFTYTDVDEVSITLGAYEVAVITYETTDEFDSYDVFTDVTISGEEYDDATHGASYKFEGGDENDYVTGSDLHDWIITGKGDDFIDGGDSKDAIYAGNGSDTVYGGKGADYITGGNGNDTIYGEKNVDTIYGGKGADYIDAGQGADLVWDGQGHDTIYLGAGNDTFTGHSKSNGGNDDTIYGGSGNDTFNLKGGNDTITGGNHDDTFIFFGDFQTDTITDFDDAGDDVIDLSNVASITDYSDLTTNHLTVVGNDIHIDGATAGNTIILQDTTLGSLSSDDFIF